MKRVISLILSVMLMVCVMTGCAKEPTPFGDVDTNVNVDLGDVTIKDDASTNFEKGTLTVNGYTNESIGLKFTAPTDMIMSTQEELDTLIESAGQQILGEDAVAYAQLTTIYDMMAKDIDGNNVMLCAEKVASSVDIDSYLEALQTGLESVGLGYTFGDVTTGTLAGCEYTRLDAEVNNQGVKMTQTYLVRRVGDRMIALSFTCIADGVLEKMMAAFSAI